MNLFNLQLEYARIMGMIEEVEGEITEDIQDLLKDVSDDKDYLIESLLNQIHQERYNQATIKAELERLKGFKESSEKREDHIKKTVIEILKFFDMKSTNKKSKGFAYKGATNSCFTVTRESVKLDEFKIAETFAPIVGKTSKFVEYNISNQVDSDKLKAINDTGLFPITSYSPTINKTKIAEYIKHIREGKQLEFTEDNEVKLDPIVEFSELVSNTSLTVK